MLLIILTAPVITSAASALALGDHGTVSPVSRRALGHELHVCAGTIRLVLDSMRDGAVPCTIYAEERDADSAPYAAL